MTKSNPTEAARKTIEKSMPRWTWPGIILVDAENKRAFVTEWNTKAARRYAEDEAGKWKPDKRMGELAQHLLGGGNLGFTPPIGICIVDCDNLQAVSHLKAHQPKSNPVMARKPHKQHFYVRCDPKTFDPLSKNYLIDTGHDDGPANLDIKSWAYPDDRIGGGYVVIPPSKHEDGVDYTWGRKLPKDRAKVPMLAAAFQTTISAMQGKATSTATAGLSRHDRTLRYMQRLVIESKSDDDPTRIAILAKSGDFIRKIFEGDAKRIADEIKMLSRSYVGASKHKSAFQGYSRDGSATHIAQRFALDHEERWRFVVSPKQMVEWDGVYWAPIPDERVLKMLIEYHRDLLTEAALESDPIAQGQLLAAAGKLRGKVFPEHVLAQLRRLYHVNREDFDQDSHLLTFPAHADLGAEAVTLNLTTGELKDPDPHDLISKIMGAPYLIGAESSHFTTWLSGSLPDDELASWVQMAWGVTMFGDNRNQTFQLAQGLSNSGKSLMLGCAYAAFGSHAMKLDPAQITDGQRGSGGPSPERKRLCQHRYVHVGELSARHRLGAAFKDVTGGDVDASRALFQDTSAGEVKATMWCASNKAPTVDASDSGLRTRIKNIPMNAGAADGEPDQRLLLAMRNDALTITAFAWWMIEGLNKVRALDFILPPNEDVDEATQEFWDDQDLFAEFVASGAIVMRPDGFLSHGEARQIYDQWVAVTHPGVGLQEKMGRNDFLSEMRRWLGIVKSQHDSTGKHRGFRGVVGSTSLAPGKRQSVGKSFA